LLRCRYPEINEDYRDMVPKKMNEAVFWKKVIESKFFYREGKAETSDEAKDLVYKLFPKLAEKKSRRKSTAMAFGAAQKTAGNVLYDLGATAGDTGFIESSGAGFASESGFGFMDRDTRRVCCHSCAPHSELPWCVCARACVYLRGGACLHTCVCRRRLRLRRRHRCWWLRPPLLPSILQIN